MSRSEVFLRQVEAFLARSRMSATAFGKACCNDPNLVSDLRAGRKPNLDLVESIQSFMSKHDRGALFESDAT